MNLFGRKEIFSDFEEINADNIVKVLNDARTDISANQTQSEYLYKYYKGEQPILHRVKEIRPEICNRIVENRANEIVSFKVGYLCGEPIQYIARSGEDVVSRGVSALNEMMFSENKATQDKEVVEWQMICGTAFRLVLPDSLMD